MAGIVGLIFDPLVLLLVAGAWAYISLFVLIHYCLERLLHKALFSSRLGTPVGFAIVVQ